MRGIRRMSRAAKRSLAKAEKQLHFFQIVSQEREPLYLTIDLPQASSSGGRTFKQYVQELMISSICLEASRFSISPQSQSRLASPNSQTRKTVPVKLSPHAFSIFSFKIPFSVTASAANLEIPSLSFSTAICSSLKSNRKSASSSR